MKNCDLILWLVRHGETKANSERRISGWTNVSLTEKGRSQASLLRPVLQSEKFDRVWSSDLDRAIETARIAYGEPTVDTRLREMHFGEVDNEFFVDISPAHKDAILEFSNCALPGGESFDQVKSRILDFINNIGSGKHLVFSHGGAIRSVTMALGQDRFIANGGIIAVNWTKKEVLFVKELTEMPQSA